jgi:hypothetical protein
MLTISGSGYSGLGHKARNSQKHSARANMKDRCMRISWLFGIFAFGLALVTGRAQELPLVKLEVAGAGFPLTLNVQFKLGGGDLPLLESSNLVEWHPFLTIFTRRDQPFRLVDRTVEQTRPGAAFYKASGEVTAPVEMEEAWRSRNMEHYRFRFSRMCFCREPVILSGVVTVRNGEVVQVEDVRDSAGALISNPDLTEFKSIEELFSILEAQRATAELVVVRIDESLRFPAWIHVDPSYSVVDDEITYYASNLVRLD